MPLYKTNISGFSGTSGTKGFSGFSGTSGMSGFSGTSGTSGYTGVGISGTSGTSGNSGTIGSNGASGTSGFSGTSGALGELISVFITKNADETTASTTVANDATLRFTLKSGETWGFHIRLISTNNNSSDPDFKAAISGYSGWSGHATCHSTRAAGTHGSASYTGTINEAPGTLAIPIIALDGGIPTKIEITGIVTASSDGVCCLQWGCNTAAANLTVMAGSILMAQRVGATY